ncbi:MAG: 4Fe-4S binding protein, partial [Clostridia bacterium]
VKITDIFRQYDENYMFDRMAGFKAFYKGLCKEEADASRCVACGACMAACPQKIQITDMLQQIHQEQCKSV